MGELFAAFAGWANWFFASEYERFKPLVASLTDVLEDRHDLYRIYEGATAVLQFRPDFSKPAGNDKFRGNYLSFPTKLFKRAPYSSKAPFLFW